MLVDSDQHCAGKRQTWGRSCTSRLCPRHRSLLILGSTSVGEREGRGLLRSRLTQSFLVWLHTRFRIRDGLRDYSSRIRAGSMRLFHNTRKHSRRCWADITRSISTATARNGPHHEPDSYIMSLCPREKRGRENRRPTSMMFLLTMLTMM